MFANALRKQGESFNYMANMNKIGYWKARKRIKTVLFKIKVLLFKIANLFENHWERRSLRRLVVRNIISGCFKANILVSVICEGIEQTFSFGKEFLDNKLWLESCILLSRFFEFEYRL